MEQSTLLIVFMVPAFGLNIKFSFFVSLDGSHHYDVFQVFIVIAIAAVNSWGFTLNYNCPNNTTHKAEVSTFR